MGAPRLESDTKFSEDLLSFLYVESPGSVDLRVLSTATFIVGIRTLMDGRIALELGGRGGNESSSIE